MFPIRINIINIMLESKPIFNIKTKNNKFESLETEKITMFQDERETFLINRDNISFDRIRKIILFAHYKDYKDGKDFYRCDNTDLAYNNYEFINSHKKQIDITRELLRYNVPHAKQIIKEFIDIEKTY
jgi:hypothetical protein